MYVFLYNTLFNIYFSIKHSANLRAIFELCQNPLNIYCRILVVFANSLYANYNIVVFKDVRLRDPKYGMIYLRSHLNYMDE